ncbi:protein TAPT1 homolog [Melanaphis sacchari]|uniref:protein TAPT1 homolog n=1 Tax=Melanaphis sacchari TaxID=742174 RepID=UPI000DC13685|nr:protein TAPT1 homolog [Melanaphis sacchari]
MGKVESATKKSNNSASLWDFICIEFKRGYSLENDEKEFSDRREKVYTFMKIPLEVEQFMFYGFCQCADSFLFVYTFLPLRALVALKSLISSSLSKFKDKHKNKRLSAAETCDLLKMAVLISCSMMLLPCDTSMMYHVIKSQSVIKLYIFFNMLEVGDRLFSSFGQDILDALFWTATEPKTSRREHFGVLPHYIIAVLYVFLHSILVLCQATTLNVAINSSHKALLAIMMSNNFVELKGSVFKKFDKTNLFQLSCSDVRERFHLFILLLIVVVQTMKEYQWTSESFWELMLDCIYVMVSEMLIDWTKHAFITRFNEINLSVYSDYILSFAYDTAQSRHRKAFTDHSDLVARRMGFIPIPLGVVMIKVLTRCVSIDGRLASIILLMFTFTCLVTLKIVNLVYILGKACKLIEFHKTSLIKNHHIINGISCQDMATSPMRPPIRKKQSWSDNKENKPSPLIDVPPLGPTPMFANSNVDIKEACLNTQILEDIMESDLTHSDSDLNLSMIRDTDTLSTKSA